MGTAIKPTGYAPVNGLHLYYESHGSGPPLVLLHGGLGSTAMLGDLRPALAQRRQVIAVDLQGHGRTADIDRPLSYEAMAEDIAALLRYLGIAHADVMGYSLGAGVALRTAIQHPALIRKLVIISVPYRRRGWYPEILAAMAQMGPESAEMMKPSPLYLTYARIAPRPEDWPVLVTKTSDLLRKDYDWADEVAALKAPTMLIFGDADSLPPAGRPHQGRLALCLAGRPGAVTRDIREPGHSLFCLSGRAMANQVTQTALGPMVTVAVEQAFPPKTRLLDDRVAYRFLPFVGKLAVSLSRVPPLRSLLIGLTERDSPGVCGGMLRRKRYIDDQVVDALKGGITTVVNLGAGWDTRAYRLSSLRAVQVFEVDLPETITAKRAKLERVFGQVPANVTLVPIDFEHQNLAEVLEAHGYRADEKALFIWEGVTQYLTEAGVRQTFAFLAQALPGSRLVFTYVQKAFLDGTAQFGLSARSQVAKVKDQLWAFGLEPDQVAAFLAPYGWREVEQMGR